MPSAGLAINSTNVRRTIAFAWDRLTIAVATALSREKAIETAARLFTTPPRFTHTPRELELLATGARFDVSSAEGTLAAWRFGRAERPAVILCHGWGGRGAQLRAFVPALTGAGFQVVLFDHAGHGLSGGAEATLVHFLKDLDAVARHVEEGGGKVAGVVAHSLGAAATAAWLNQTGREMRQKRQLHFERVLTRVRLGMLADQPRHRRRRDDRARTIGVDRRDAKGRRVPARGERPRRRGAPALHPLV